MSPYTTWKYKKTERWTSEGIAARMRCNVYFNEVGAHPSWGGCRAAAPSQNPQNRNLKNTNFVDITISKVSRDFPFSRNQPLKSADDQYISILKNKLIKLKNKTGHCY
jgi:hypothetical protein